MSSQPHASSHDHGHESASHAHHGHSNGHGAGHGSFKSYMIGFILSVVLTAIPFILVMGGVFDSKLTTAVFVMAFGVVQIVVHMIYFLHMNPRSEGGWTMMALLFTIVIVGIMLAGSLWVMHHLNTNMMPMSPEMMKNMP
ncbi:cytochrome o ubiquinol oxidase subunit IV [Rhizobium sp. XQZ8]|uniref:cytochrome o ubiquinol oxidase subunit IV n=1 Tax=Rhizobium populisoli TaxID=2859785 RepID=UPI001CA592D0|nr:cytochrome o ubiquinol oxidase subunit IV [Rhizobium populisoli]MBW6422118.1 cytochrome o ubiquinol oxidase subunit IV [Rhizobium populisoli]